MTRRRRRDERGFVLPTRLMLVSVSAVALAGLLFVALHGSKSGDIAAPAAARPTATAHGQPTPGGPGGPVAPVVTVTPSVTAPPPPVVHRGRILVVVFNNSNVKGLAGKTAARAQAAGWNVAGSDNWYGTIDTSTVYYGPHLSGAARLLARDLGITSIKPAVNPMRADRLTVILTSTYH